MACWGVNSWISTEIKNLIELFNLLTTAGICLIITHGDPAMPTSTTSISALRHLHMSYTLGVAVGIELCDYLLKKKLGPLPVFIRLLAMK